MTSPLDDRQAAASSHPEPLVVRTVRIDAPDDLLSLLPADAPLTWVRRGDGLVGWGEAARTEVGGPDRFADAERWWQGLVRHAVVRDEVGLPGTGPVAFGSFAFDDLSAAGGALVVPRVVVGRRDGQAWLTVVETAGTLGAFVTVDGAVHALSNYHVLAGSPRARVGDVVLQPGPADGGTAPADRVGTLAATVPLAPGRVATVDAAVALLDDPGVDPTYPVGPITTTAVAVGGEDVAKIGRTTAVTRGRVSAIELDEVVVGYGEELGELRFDDQIEVETTGTGPFSRGGDSGSLVYRADGVALGLLFAGSETGGENGTGLTYVNPIDAVLTALGARLLGSPAA